MLQILLYEVLLFLKDELLEQTLSLKNNDNAWPASNNCEGQMVTPGDKNEIFHWFPTDDSWWSRKHSELVLLVISMRTRNSWKFDEQGVICTATSTDGNT